MPKPKGWNIPSADSKRKETEKSATKKKKKKRKEKMGEEVKFISSLKKSILLSPRTDMLT